MGKFVFPLKEIQPQVSQTFVCYLNNRNKENILHRLRMGNIGLNENLFELNQHETGHCSFCVQVKETINHYLCKCPLYLIERAMLITETGVGNEDAIPSLLKSTEPAKQEALVNFVLRSKRVHIY